MFCELTIYTLHREATPELMKQIELAVTGPRLLGCWQTFLGNRNRIHVLRSADATSDHETLRRGAIKVSKDSGYVDAIASIEVDIYATLPCIPSIETGAFGAVYEIRSYELLAFNALDAAYQGWADVLEHRLRIAPITTVMHSVAGRVPRLVHIYPYDSLQHRREVRDKAIATGYWPPKGGAHRNMVMRTEMAIPAAFSPIH